MKSGVSPLSKINKIYLIFHFKLFLSLLGSVSCWYGYNVEFNILHSLRLK